MAVLEEVGYDLMELGGAREEVGGVAEVEMRRIIIGHGGGEMGYDLKEHGQRNTEEMVLVAPPVIPMLTTTN